MKYGIFSDVHGNLEAFESACDYYDNCKIDKFIFLGDIVGYGANPRECISLLKKLKPVLIAGNHDFAVLNKIRLNFFNPYAKAAIKWTKKQLKFEDFKYLNKFELIYEEDKFIGVHGSLANPEKFYYINDKNEALINFNCLKKNICFVGHSHRMGTYELKEDGSILYIRSKYIKLNCNAKYIVNVGSVGQPRDGDPKSCLCIYDNVKDDVEFFRLEYDIKKAADKIVLNGLPSWLADRLYEGW